MRSVALIAAFFLFSTACKSSEDKALPKKGAFTGNYVAPDDSDDSAIDVPKELHATVARDKAATDLPGHFLKPGSRIQASLKSSKGLKLGLSLGSGAGNVLLKVEGAGVSSLGFQGSDKQFDIPLKSQSTETVVITVPSSAGASFRLTRLSALGGEIVEWKILEP